MELKKHKCLAYRLSNIIVRLNKGKRLNIFELADTYKVSTRILKKVFQDRLMTLDFVESGTQFYRLETKKIGCFDLVDIKRFTSI